MSWREASCARASIRVCCLRRALSAVMAGLDPAIHEAAQVTWMAGTAPGHDGIETSAHRAFISFRLAPLRDPLDRAEHAPANDPARRPDQQPIRQEHQIRMTVGTIHARFGDQARLLALGLRHEAEHEL